MQILYHFPESANQSFRAKYRNLPWRYDENDFSRWKNGTTGFLIIDAGMRELVQTGYMHNRVRMITASFFCKQLLMDWRIGEAFFAGYLLDFEQASNVGSWQWAAGTGCDAAPYFRIFNPDSQTKKFDPDLTYIKKWVPELNSKQYPKPVVKYKSARERALKTYQEAVKKF